MWGYLNKNGTVLIEPKYNRVEDFHEGFARFKKNNQWGFIDTIGINRFEQMFDGAYNFKNGYARIKIIDKWGLIDKTGKIIIEPKYQNISDVFILTKE